MVRIPSLRRSETAPEQDENRDGRIDERDARVSGNTTRVTGSQPVAGSRQDGTTAGTATADGATDDGDGARGGRTATVDRDRTATDRGAADQSANDQTSRHRATEETALHRPVPDRPGTATGTARPVTDRTDPTRTADVDGEPEIAVVPGPKPRASLLATLSLIVGVAAALVVLTGALAGYGIGLGVLAMLLAIGGISATGRRHIAGKSDALIGLVLGLGAVVVGILALTGQFAWPNTDVDTVQRFREWLDSQSIDRF